LGVTLVELVDYLWGYLDYGTQKTPLFTGVNSIFRLAPLTKSQMVIPRRIELLLPG
jgi:hypothetical protein